MLIKSTKINKWIGLNKNTKENKEEKKIKKIKKRMNEWTRIF